MLKGWRGYIIAVMAQRPHEATDEAPVAAKDFGTLNFDWMRARVVSPLQSGAEAGQLSTWGMMPRTQKKQPSSSGSSCELM